MRSVGAAPLGVVGGVVVRCPLRAASRLKARRAPFRGFLSGQTAYRVDLDSRVFLRGAGVFHGPQAEGRLYQTEPAPDLRPWRPGTQRQATRSTPSAMFRAPWTRKKGVGSHYPLQRQRVQAGRQSRLLTPTQRLYRFHRHPRSYPAFALAFAHEVTAP